MDCIDIDTGIKDLLLTANIDIIKLLLRDGNVTEDYLIKRAKVYFVETYQITSTRLIDFFYDVTLMDKEMAQECMRLLFASTDIRSGNFIAVPSKTLRNLLDCGAVIPAEEKYLSKLAYDDFIEHIGPSGVKVGIELEKACIDNSRFDVWTWVHQNSCDNIHSYVIDKLWKLTDEQIIFYINNFTDSDLVDDMILNLFKWNRLRLSPLLNHDHQCCEELSLFITLQCQNNAHFGITKTMQDELSKMIHPNIKKNEAFYAIEDLQHIDKISSAYRQVSTPSTLVINFAVFRQNIYENARILLDYIEAY